MIFQKRRQHYVIPIVLIGLALSLLIAANCFATGVRGTFITLGKGYQDLAQDDHFILAPGLRLHVNRIGGGSLSFHTYVQYYGDTADDFGDSGTFRFYHGYLKYQNPNTPVNGRIGRFFLFRGVALGVLDGGEVTFRIANGFEVTGFGGIQGPLSREFEFDEGEEDAMYGGEIRWRPRSFPFGTRTVIAASYTHQERFGEDTRDLAGLTYSFRLGNRWRVLNVAQIRMASSPLRKVLSRWQYYSDQWHLRMEASVLKPAVSAESWFEDFQHGTMMRGRAALEHYFESRKWGLGISALVFGSEEMGFQGGPVLIFPYGRFGYNTSSGEQARNNVWWGYARVSPVSHVDLFAYVAGSEFEWEAFDITPQKTTMMNIGTEVRPSFLKRTEWKLEWQNYTTPQLDADRRILISFRWNFDY